MSIEYDPSKTVQEMADEAGVSDNVVRNFLQRSKIDYRTERQNYIKEQVERFLSENKDVTAQNVADSLKLSLPTVKKYLKLAFNGKMESKKKTTPRDSRIEGLSVSNSDSNILKDILKIYLPGKKTFDCDLTFGRGGFYTDGIPVPKHRYDKNIEHCSKKYSPTALDETRDLSDECFDSVVIDLPISIDNKEGKSNKKSNVNAFHSLSEMYDAYDDMLTLAERLLKPGGIAVFKTVDFVLRNDITSKFNGYWATDKAIDIAQDLDFELTDRFILANRKYLQTSGSQKIRTGLQHGYFLVFTKI